MRLHYEVAGYGQPLVLLHGLFGSADNWSRIARHFSQYYQVIRVDLRNHGRSPHHASQTLAEMSNDLLELCDALDLSSIYLLGHSLGGRVAMQFATQSSTRVARLVVVDMAIRAYPDVHTQLINAMLAVNLSQMPSRSAVDKVLASAIPDLMVRQFLLTNLINVEGQLKWRCNLPALQANYHYFQAMLEVHYASPCLFVLGEHSDYVLPADISQIQKCFPYAAFVSLPTDHWVHAEQPQLFIQTVEHFLNTSY